jgi:putative flippase GtrA
MDTTRPAPGFLKRAPAFAAVGLIGIVVQVACLWWLASVAGLHYLAATALATEVTVLHNFAWHQRWTWRDRPAQPVQVFRRLVRFNASNGAVSLGGNLVLMAVFVGALHMPIVAANLVAILFCALLNLLISDLWVFRA